MIRRLVKLTKKLTDHKQNEYITTTEFNASFVQANLVTKTDFDNKFSSLNRKIVSNKTKDIAIANELGYFRGKNHFDEDGK